MRRITGLIAGMFLAASAYAAQPVMVSGAWVRAMAPGQDNAAVSLNITSQENARLVAASSPLAKRTEIHTMKQKNGMMVMREVDSLPLPAKQQVRLGAGDHIMLIGVKHPLKVGEKIPLKLTVEFKGKRKRTVKVNAEVRLAAPDNDMKEMKGM
jgi:copper(I)-binding protein